MTKIFISYRHEDSADIVGRIYDYLTPPLGPFQRDDVFKDVDAIPLGVNFKTHLEEAVSKCAVQLVIIGPRWLTVTDDSGQRRLNDPQDFVRIEVETALKRKIPVIPLLVMGATMPGERDLPTGLRELSYQNGTAVRRDPDFKGDMARVIKAIEQWLTEAAKPRSKSKPLPRFTLPMLEWIDIPGGKVTLQADAELYSIAPFSISKYPVTYAQFEAFIDAPDGYRNDQWWHDLAHRDKTPGVQAWKTHNHPRENVNWYEAVAFTRWLSAKMGVSVTLPTEAQWVLAAQGRDERKYPWGKNFDKTRCNTSESEINKTTPVDSYPTGASPYGVMDMSGNVQEWCLNRYGYPGKTDIRGDYHRILKGGSWAFDRDIAQVTYHGTEADPNYRNRDIGFRLVMTD